MIPHYATPSTPRIPSLTWIPSAANPGSVPSLAPQQGTPTSISPTPSTVSECERYYGPGESPDDRERFEGNDAHDDSPDNSAKKPSLPIRKELNEKDPLMKQKYQETHLPMQKDKDESRKREP
jgi:hypothetical protein